VLRYKVGVVSSHAGGKAMARYLASEATLELEPEKRGLARYYAGEIDPAVTMTEGVRTLGRLVDEGSLSFSEALESLMAVEIGRGTPSMTIDYEAMEDRLAASLADGASRWKQEETLARGEGLVLGELRPDLDPRLAARVGIMGSGPLSVDESGHLLNLRRVDGTPIPGKQIQSATRSVAEVFGLDERVVPAAEASATCWAACGPTASLRSTPRARCSRRPSWTARASGLRRRSGFRRAGCRPKPSGRT